MQTIANDLVARLIHESLEQLGWKHDAVAIAELVQRLNIGLPAEDELSAIISWLGNCHLIHKLDQLQSPSSSKDKYQVPDLLAVFNFKGREVPVLIEVKVKRSNSLSWRPDYYEGLCNYGKILNLPVLVAWKFHGLWILFDINLFKIASKNYNITYQKALQNSLMGILAGDFVYTLQNGFGFHILSRKDKLIEAAVEEDGSKTEQWQSTIEDAYFTDGKSNRVNKLGSGLWPLFISYPQEESTKVNETHIKQSFVVAGNSTMQFAHTGIVQILNFFTSGSAGIKWRQVLQESNMPTSRKDLRVAAEEGISNNFVQYVIDHFPQTIPLFLQ